MKQSVVTAFKETIFCKLDELKEMQGKLKSLEKLEYEKFKKQMIENGFTDPFNIWIDDKGKKHILDGHTRKFVLLGLREEGIEIPELFPCNVIEAKSRKEAIKKLLGMVSQYGKASMESLSDFAINEGIDFSWLQENTDIPNVDLDELEVESDPELDAKADEVPEVEENIHNVKLGQIWKLGNHRLMCGDSTDEATIAALMNGEKADMVFTDPPYGMFLDTDYDSMFGADKSHRKTGKRFNEVKGDHEDFTTSLIETIFQNFGNCKEMFIWGADYFTEFLENRKDGSWVVWDKRCSENMDKVSGNTFELCWSKQKHKRLIARIMWSGHHGMQKDDTKTRVHPTQKPAKLIEWFFDQWGKESRSVVDLYGGSGSTLIACEKTNRKCFMMELDPHYCSVIIERWQNFTGKKAELLNG